MKRKILQFALLLALGVLLSASVKAQNMYRYITLTVTEGQDISLNLWADADNTPVSIVSGDQEYNITVGADWTGNTYYIAGATTMTIYGNILKFDCSSNGSNISGLGVSNNTALTEIQCHNNQITILDVSYSETLAWLYCNDNQLISLNVSNCTALAWLDCSNNPLSVLDASHCPSLARLYCNGSQLTSLFVSGCTALRSLNCFGNLLTTAAVDALFCTLPEKETSDNATIYILNNASDANYADVIASNKQNAIDKNWHVWYYDDFNISGDVCNTDIPETTGDYDCTIGIADIEYANIEVYPNPVKAQLHIQSDTELIKVELYNAQGSLVQQHTHTTNIDVSGLPNGIYMLKLFTETGVYRTKIVKN